MIDLKDMDDLLAWMRENGVQEARSGDLSIRLADFPFPLGEAAEVEGGETPTDDPESEYGDKDLWGGKIPPRVKQIVDRIAERAKAKESGR